jgi:tetratricopeptide (TPR) repeat protein
VIGFLYSHRLWKVGFLILLAVAVLELQGRADDQLKKKDGTLIDGQIVKVADGQVFVNRTSDQGSAQLRYYLSDIQSVTMAQPAEMTKVKDAAPATVIAALEPLLKQYAGLPADWVVEAMGQLADAYDASGKADLAKATYDQIDKQFPGSLYHIQVVAGTAQLDIQHGKIDDAIAALKPLVEKANQTLAPSPLEGRLYGRVFLVYGEALAAQKNFPQALEAYLTVKTIFYQNPTLAEQADQLANKLRQENPGLSID